MLCGVPAAGWCRSSWTRTGWRSAAASRAWTPCSGRRTGSRASWTRRCCCCQPGPARSSSCSSCCGLARAQGCGREGTWQAAAERQLCCRVTFERGCLPWRPVFVCACIDALPPAWQGSGLAHVPHYYQSLNHQARSRPGNACMLDTRCDSWGSISRGAVVVSEASSLLPTQTLAPDTQFKEQQAADWPPASSWRHSTEIRQQTQQAASKQRHHG